MSTKFLNIIIVTSIIGICLLIIKDIVFPNDEISDKNTYIAKERILPTLTPTISPIPSVSCNSTVLGDIRFNTLTYQVRTKNNIAFAILESSKEASLKNEQLTLTLKNKSEGIYEYSLGNNSNDLSLICMKTGVYLQIFDNKLMILNDEEPQKGSRWTGTSIIQAPIGGTNEGTALDFDYSVVDVLQKNVYGENRTEITVDAHIDSMKIMQYKILSGVGLTKLSINVDLEQLGSYYKEITLQSAR